MYTNYRSPECTNVFTMFFPLKYFFWDSGHSGNVSFLAICLLFVLAPFTRDISVLIKGIMQTVGFYRKINTCLHKEKIGIMCISKCFQFIDTE